MSWMSGSANGRADGTHEPLNTRRHRLIVEHHRQSLDHTQTLIF